jgi:hypothetical protein
MLPMTDWTGTYWALLVRHRRIDAVCCEHLFGAIEVPNFNVGNVELEAARGVPFGEDPDTPSGRRYLPGPTSKPPAIIR